MPFAHMVEVELTILSYKVQETDVHPGQLIFLNIPAVSRLSYHPFTIANVVESQHPGAPTCATIHVKALGPYTKVC